MHQNKINSNLDTNINQHTHLNEHSENSVPHCANHNLCNNNINYEHLNTNENVTYDKFHGFIPATVTPFKDSKIDFISLEKYIKFLLSSGVRTFLINGSTAESLLLSDSEKIEIIKFLIDLIKQTPNTKIITGIIETCTHKCVEFVKVLNTIDNIDAYLSIVPFYVKPSEYGVIQHYQSISNVSEREIILYNNPSRCGIEMSENVFMHVSSLKNVIGIKECSANLTRFITFQKYHNIHNNFIKDAYCNTLKNEQNALHFDICHNLSQNINFKNHNNNFIFLSGNDDTALAALNYGVKGCISVISNIIPLQCDKIYQNWISYNISEFLTDTKNFVKHVCTLQKFPSPCSVKFLLSELGLMSDEVRLPLAQLQTDEKKLLLDSFQSVF